MPGCAVLLQPRRKALSVTAGGGHSTFVGLHRLTTLFFCFPTALVPCLRRASGGRAQIMKTLGLDGDNKKLSREEAVKRAKALPRAELPLQLKDGIRVRK